MIRPIIHFPDPLLKTISTHVTDATSPEIALLVEDLKDTMRAKKGIGLAAIQIGIPLRVFIMELPGASVQIFINPQYKPVDDQTCTELEGCLSVPNYQAKVKRAASIEVRYTDLEGHEHQETFTGLQAICFQHEFDHLEGIVYIDHLGSVHRTRAFNAVRK